MTATADLYPLRDSDASWMGYAACANVSEEKVDFFPETDPLADPRARLAMALCAICPVQNECLAFAQTNDIRHGIWGGRSGGRRRSDSQQIADATIRAVARPPRQEIDR